MAEATKDAEAEKPAEAPKVREVPTSLTFKDDKRAQYARLVLFNAAKGNPKAFGLKAADVGDDPNEFSNEHLLIVGKALVGGTYLDGKAGLEFIQEHSANGSTTGRALTTSYASEVRPFIRKLIVSESFGRRGGLSDEEKAAKAAEALQRRIESAAERGKVDLKSIKGTGEKSAVTLEDVKNAVTARKEVEKAEADKKKAEEKAKKEKEAAEAKAKAEKEAAKEK